MEIMKAVVSEYDPKTCTTVVTASDGSGTFKNATMMLPTLDYGSGSYDVTPPTPGSPCLIARVNGEVFIMGGYLPVNLGNDADNAPPAGQNLEMFTDQNPDKPSTTGSSYSRTPSDYPAKATLPGDKVVKGSSGSEVGFFDNLYRIKISPLLYTVWNSINNIFELCAGALRIKSPALEVHSVLETNKDCNVQVLVRNRGSDLGGTPMININMGQNAGVATIAINGQQLLHVTADRNVFLTGKNLIVDFDNVDMSQSRRCRLP